jgi:hypothetical protein
MDKLGLISRNKNSISNLTRHRLAPGEALFLAVGTETCGLWAGFGWIVRQENSLK